MIKSDNFWLGFFVSLCINSLHQDLMGKEKYIKYIDFTWVDTPYWIWIVLILLCVGIRNYEGKK